MKVLQTNFFGDHNIGLFGKASDKFCIVGNLTHDKNIKSIAEVLKVKVVKATVANTDLVGIFCCVNSNGIILPKVVSERELNMFNALKKHFNVNVGVLNSKFTAVGNLVLTNDNGAVVSELLGRNDKKTIEDCLGVESIQSSIAKIHTVGSCGISTNKGCLVHRDAGEEEIKKIEGMLKVSADIGTANFGSPFVGSCAIANSKGALVGESTSGPEINRIMEALGL